MSRFTILQSNWKVLLIMEDFIKRSLLKSLQDLPCLRIETHGVVRSVNGPNKECIQR